MLQSNALEMQKEVPQEQLITDNCTLDRIKPTLLRDVKTEALLVFSRTALERYFKNIKELNWEPTVGTDSATLYVYSELKELLSDLQKHVVNVDYLVTVSKYRNNSASLNRLAKVEEPLINYYDVMAKKVSTYYADKPAYIPEFLVICVLSHWILEEEKSISLYPFLNKYDFTKLIDLFESNRSLFLKDGECVLSDIHGISIDVVEKLKAKKYKINSGRVAKSRKKK